MNNDNSSNIGDFLLILGPPEIRFVEKLCLRSITYLNLKSFRAILSELLSFKDNNIFN